MNKKNHTTNNQNIPIPYEKPGWILHLFALFLLVGVAGLLAWANFGKLDVVSIATGEVIPSGQIRKVQHLEGGIVKEILVDEGDFVKKGQPLVVLAGTANGADVDELSIRLASLQVETVRLEAKANDKQTPKFTDELSAKHPDMVKQALDLFQTERLKHLNDIKIQKNLISQKQQDLKQIRVRIANSKKNLKFLNEQVGISEDLLAEDLNDRYTHITLLRERTAVNNQRDEDSVSLERTRSVLQESKSILNGLTHSYKEKARKHLEQKRQDYKELSRRLRKYYDQLQRTEMRAPAEGIIKYLGVSAIGEVIKAGDTVAEIVAEDDYLIVETLLLPGNVGYIKAGQEALIMLSSADAIRFEKLKGKVTRISPDTFVSNDGLSYYKVKIKPEQDYFQGKNWRYQLKAGVQVSANILIGKRSVLDYFLEPFLGSLTSSLSEI